MENLKTGGILGNIDDCNIYYCKILLAGKKIEVESKNKRTLAFFRGYLSHFGQPDFVIRASQKEIDEEQIPNYGEIVKAINRDEDIAVENQSAETNAIYRKIADRILEYGIILMHGAAVSVNKKCYIFTAPSGTGKTTHINNWLKAIPDTFVVNGDKPLIDVEKGLVYGTPWCGKEGQGTNTVAPLAGLIHLERGVTNTILPISFKEMLPCLLQQVYIPVTGKERILAYKCLDRIKDIPCYRLKCNMDLESAITAYRGIKDNERKNGQ